MSADSSGWNVRASLFPVLTPTISSPLRADTSAASPCAANLGARMNTPGKSRPSSEASRVAWNESAWLPYALRSISASTRGAPPSCGSARIIAPAQVPKTGRESSERIHLKRAGRSLDAASFPVSRIVVDSPPGITMA